jgi:hypothetical protein
VSKLLLSGQLIYVSLLVRSILGSMKLCQASFGRARLRGATCRSDLCVRLRRDFDKSVQGLREKHHGKFA